MTRKPMKKFGTGKRYADAGTVTKAPEMSLNDIRLRRKTDDIQSDYMKAQARHAGNTAKLNIAKAKFEQRNADAKDDDAKRRGADRTATRAGEKAAESALSEARRTKGDSIARRDALGAKLDAEGPAITPSKLPDLKVSGAPRISASSNRPVARRSAPAPVTPRPGPRAGAAAPAPRVTPTARPTGGNPLTSGKRSLTGAEYEQVFKTGVIPGYTSDEDRNNIYMTMRALQQAGGAPAPVTPKSMTQYTDPSRMADTKNYLNSIGFFFGGTVKKKPAAKKPVRKYAKGGSIDGCAIRGKTRAGRTK